MQITGRLATAMLKLTKKMAETDPWNIFAIDEEACVESAVTSPEPQDPTHCNPVITEVDSFRRQEGGN